MAQDLIKIGLFNRDAAIIAAVEKGFLKQENIDVEINTVTDSGPIYFDGVTVLIFLLLTGRYLQQRGQRKRCIADAFRQKDILAYWRGCCDQGIYQLRLCPLSRVIPAPCSWG